MTGTALRHALTGDVWARKAIEQGLIQTTINQAEAGDLLKGNVGENYVRFLVKRWQDAYLRLRLTPDFSRVIVPDHIEGLDWLMAISDITLNEAVGLCREYYPCRSFTDDLDSVFPTHARSAANGPYINWTIESYDLPPEYCGRPLSHWAAKGLAGMTLLERVLLDLKVFLETRRVRHFDQNSVTLCIGSRGLSGGRIICPTVTWSGDEMFIGSNFDERVYATLGVRPVAG